MNRHQQRVMLLFSLLIISAALLGCASNRAAEQTTRVGSSPYEQDLVRARASITEAEQAGAAEFGGPQLTLARDKVRAAELAFDDGAGERADQLAVEAGLDAELALAITRNKQTQTLVTEVQSGLQALEDELKRTGGTDADRL